jgi:hypothetical protein
MTDIEFQPDVDEVLQMEPETPLTSIPVCVEEVRGPVRVQELPRKAGATKTVVITDTVPHRVLRADHYRAEATLISFEQDFYFALNPQSAQEASQMARWPALVPLVLSTTTPVYVVALTSSTTTVSVITELWATGE